MDTDELDLDLSVREVPVRMGGRRYLLREATAAAACQYRNAVLRSTRLDQDGKPEYVDGLADAGPVLVAGCLFEVDGDGLKPVPLATVRGLPSRVQEQLFDRAKRLSELDQRAPTTDVAKNGPSATATVSP
jgi:hypothetical protein